MAAAGSGVSCGAALSRADACCVASALQCASHDGGPRRAFDARGRRVAAYDVFETVLTAIKSIRRMPSGDPKYHSGRKKKEFAPQHADGIRYADVTEGERVLNEIIYECQRSLEAIEHAKLDLEARQWARARGLKG